MHPQGQRHGGRHLAVVGIEARQPDPGAYIGGHDVVGEGQGTGEVQGIHRQPIRLVGGDGGRLMAVEQLYHAGIVDLLADEQAPVARALPLQGVDVARVRRGLGFIHRLEVEGGAVTEERRHLPAQIGGRFGPPALTQRQQQSHHHHSCSFSHGLPLIGIDRARSISEPLEAAPK
ncbi:hypothetical protein D3C72_1542720 [compost metagenome]